MAQSADPPPYPPPNVQRKGFDQQPEYAQWQGAHPTTPGGSSQQLNPEAPVFTPSSSPLSASAQPFCPQQSMSSPVQGTVEPQQSPSGLSARADPFFPQAR